MSSTSGEEGEAEYCSEVFDQELGSDVDDIEERGSRSESIPEFTVQEGLDLVGFGRYQIFLAVICGITWALDACQVLSLSLTTAEMAEEFDATGFWEALFGISSFFGMGIGAVVLGQAADIFGRKLAILATPMICLAFGILSAVSPNYWTLVVSQFLVGFGVGGAAVAFSMFMEVAPEKRRGALLIAFELFWSVGSLYEAGICWIVIPNFGWRWLIAVSCIPMLIPILAIVWILESPRYLISQDNAKGAAMVIRRIAEINGSQRLPRDFVMVASKKDDVSEGDETDLADLAVLEGENAPLSGRPVFSLEAGRGESLSFRSHGDGKSLTRVPSCVIPRDQEWERSAESSEEDETRVSVPHVQNLGIKKEGNRPAQRSVWTELFSRQNIRGTILLWILWFCNTYVYYGLIFFTPLFFSRGSSKYLLTFVTTFGELPGLFIAFFVIDLLGRRKTIGLFFALCAVAIALLTLVHVGLSFFILAVFSLTARACSIGAFDTTYAYTSEVYPTSVRSTALGACSSWSRVAGMVSPILPFVISLKYAWIPLTVFFSIALFASIVSFFLPFETSGRSLVDSSTREE